MFGWDSLQELAKIFGALNAVLIIACALLWRKLEKTQAQYIELLKQRTDEKQQEVDRYHSFADAIRGLTQAITAGRQP